MVVAYHFFKILIWCKHDLNLGLLNKDIFLFLEKTATKNLFIIILYKYNGMEKFILNSRIKKNDQK